MNVKELLINQASAFGEKPALLYEEKTITFQQLKDYAFKLANYLRRTGVKKPERVAVFLPNIPEAAYCYMAVYSLGATLVPFDYMLTENEIIHLLNHCEARALIILPRKDIDVTNIRNNCWTLKEIIVLKETVPENESWNECLESSSPNTPVSEILEKDLACVFYTSGSTGHPKGVMLSYKHLDNPVDTINHFLGVCDKDIYLTGGIPFTHIGGLNYLLLMIRFGSSIVLMSRFQPLEFLRNLERYRITVFCIVPSMFIAILSLKDYYKFNLSALRYAVVFGAPSSQEILKKFHKACPKTILLNGWGMTETAAPNTFSPPDISKIASIGKFGFHMQAQILDDAGNPLYYGEKGELLVKGEAVMQGYYREHTLTSDVFYGDGWLMTGDIAYRHNDGLIYLCGRKKDMIKVAGELVFSSEVEEKILLHPRVQEAAVIGVPDELRGEVPKGFIVAKEGETIDLQELKDFLREHLAHFKIPHHFELLKELPKNRVGKVDKQALQKSTKPPEQQSTSEE
jgi:long-chain acyl-CoA synthetase